MLISLVMLGGCASHYGINVGFNRQTFIGRQPGILIAARSYGFYFDIGNVEIEYFFGPEYRGTDYENRMILLYFFNDRVAVNDDLLSFDGNSDYHSISEHLFIIEAITSFDFYSGKYDVSRSMFRRRLSFNHSQIITIPQEFLINRESSTYGGFSFGAGFFTKHRETWSLDMYTSIDIGFRMVDKNTVRLYPGAIRYWWDQW